MSIKCEGGPKNIQNMKAKQNKKEETVKKFKCKISNQDTQVKYMQFCHVE